MESKQRESSVRKKQSEPDGKQVLSEFGLTVPRSAIVENLANVDTILATETNPRLPANSIDLVLLVDAYHEFAYPREVMTGVAAGLKPGGRVVLIEYRAEDPRVPIKRLHKMSAEQAIAEMRAVGLDWETTLDFLPQQHFLVFRKPGQQASAGR